jgi:hypothetical protein
LKISPKQGIEPFTWHFMFDGAPAAKRNGVFIGSGRRQILLSQLIEKISSEQRKRIFPGMFDFGNQVTSDATFLKKDLVMELESPRVP